MIKSHLCAFFLILINFQIVLGQNYNPSYIGDDQLIWCTISEPEYRKCNEWAMAIENIILNIQYRGDVSPVEFHLICIRSTDRDQCMSKIANNVAHLVTLDPGEIFIAGRYYSLVPIAAEKYGQFNESGYYSVALIKRNSQILSLNDLKNKKACFSGVGQLAGWVLPISKLLDENIMEVKNCNNMVKTAANFFNVSCAPNSLIDKHNPSGDNPQSICSLCQGSCSGNEHYSNFDGALRCLANVGDVAFVKHNTVDLAINQLNHEQQLLGQFATRPKLTRYDFELLCPNGGKASIDSYQQCNFGFVPGHAVVVSSSMHPEKRIKVQEFLYNCSTLFSKKTFNSNNFFSTLLNKRNNKTFELFGSPPVNMFSQELFHVNLLFSEDTSILVPIEESRQTFKGYLGDFVQYFEKMRKCPVPLSKLCITSEKELIKCNSMVTAFRAQMLKPQLACVLRNTSVECMKSIAEGLADLTVLDAGDIHKAGHMYKLIPIVAEKYNLEDTNYYAVAVTKQSNKDIDLLDLKGKQSCHSAYLNGAGYIMPINFLLTNNRMRSYGCNSVKATAQFFSKSCIPGALSLHYTENSLNWGLLCELCHGTSYRFCSRNHAEPFYGNTGALRCLVESGGDVAFLRHTTIFENTAGRNRMFWSRNLIPNDFELLCRDGSRAQYNEYKSCNLGKIPANAIVTSEFKPAQHIESYINLFLIAQEIYGSKYSEDYKFKMFVSPIESGYSDLIFQDATSSLVAIPESKRNYKKYLGVEFMRAIRNVDCASSSFIENLSNLLLIVLIISNIKLIKEMLF